MKTAILMMQKNEDQLLAKWLDYHGFLFGFDNLFVWDNGSDPQTLRILKEYEALGVNIVWWMKHEVDFRRKGLVLGEKIKELDKAGAYDFHIPLDCDEFIAVEDAVGTLRCDPKAINAELRLHQGQDAVLGVDWSYYNILGHDAYFWRRPHRKSLFAAGTFKVMDHGYHEGRTIGSDERRPTRLVYVHYHHKPHEVIVEHSKAKVRPYWDVDDPEVLAAKAKEGNRLAIFIAQSRDDYMAMFMPDDGHHMPNVPGFFDAIGIGAPFR